MWKRMCINFYIDTVDFGSYVCVQICYYTLCFSICCIMSLIFFFFSFHSVLVEKDLSCFDPPDLSPFFPPTFPKSCNVYDLLVFCTPCPAGGARVLPLPSVCASEQKKINKNQVRSAVMYDSVFFFNV